MNMGGIEPILTNHITNNDNERKNGGNDNNMTHSQSLQSLSPQSQVQSMQPFGYITPPPFNSIHSSPIFQSSANLQQMVRTPPPECKKIQKNNNSDDHSIYNLNDSALVNVDSDNNNNNNNKNEKDDCNPVIINSMLSPRITATTNQTPRLQQTPQQLDISTQTDVFWEDLSDYDDDDDNAFGNVNENDIINDSPRWSMEAVNGGFDFNNPRSNHFSRMFRL